MSDINERIKKDVTDNQVYLYMKGNPRFPQCGFSARAIQILEQLGVKYGSANVLEDPELRQGIKEYSQWPTIPQLYINGEFIGGSDIMDEMYQSGELAKLIGKEA